MAVTQLSGTIASPVIAARATPSVAPTNVTDGFLVSSDGGVVRMLVTYTGAVTAAVVRLWVRDRVSLEWFRGASSTDAGALAPTTDGREARDWFIGEGAEFTLQLEAITPSGSTPTVAVAVMGVSS